MTYPEAIEFLKDYAFKLGNGAQVELEGEIGIDRECVGIATHGGYLDYGDECEVEKPAGAYHKGPYLAVLGRAEDSTIALAEWCKRLQAAGYVKCLLEADADFAAETDPGVRLIRSLMGQQWNKRLVKVSVAPAQVTDPLGVVTKAETTAITEDGERWDGQS